MRGLLLIDARFINRRVNSAGLIQALFILVNIVHSDQSFAGHVLTNISDIQYFAIASQHLFA